MMESTCTFDLFCWSFNCFIEFKFLPFVVFSIFCFLGKNNKGFKYEAPRGILMKILFVFVIILEYLQNKHFKVRLELNYFKKFDFEYLKRLNKF